MAFRKSRCYNGGNQHKFTPRYNERPNSGIIKMKGALITRNFFYYQEYLFDICEWCGKKIRKEQ